MYFTILQDSFETMSGQNWKQSPKRGFKNPAFSILKVYWAWKPSKGIVDEQNTTRNLAYPFSLRHNEFKFLLEEYSYFISSSCIFMNFSVKHSYCTHYRQENWSIRIGFNQSCYSKNIVFYWSDTPASCTWYQNLHWKLGQ